MNAAQLISQVKNGSGLTVRQLALRADLAASTYTRIQSGDIDPTVGTVTKLLNAAGCQLRMEAIPIGNAIPKIGDLADGWSERNGKIRIDWPRWRAFLDHLHLHPDDIPEAIYSTPLLSTQPIIDALLAAVAEKLADDVGLPRPTWTRRIPALTVNYRPPNARGIAPAHVPTQLAARGLEIDTESLWRHQNG